MNKSHNSERGAAHLILIVAFVALLLGALGFLGYNAWQKQSANAGGESTLARGGRGADGSPLLKCVGSITASPVPNYRASTTYTVKVKALTDDVRVRLILTHNTTHHGRAIFGQWVSIQKGKTQAVSFASATPRLVDGERVNFEMTALEGSGVQWCQKKFSISAIAD